MANEPPRPTELAYLAELKTRFRELRQRQAAFMEQTAHMLIRMSTTTVGEAILERSNGSTGHVNIKRLIRRFEDLRKTSEQLNNLHKVPEELINVDVRRLLKDYEKFIEEGNVLQESWLRLRKSTECCLALTESETLSTVNKQNPKESNDSPSEISIDWASNYSKTESEDFLLVKSGKPNCYNQKYGHARWGALMQLMLRLSPFHTCRKRRKKL